MLILAYGGKGGVSQMLIQNSKLWSSIETYSQAKAKWFVDTCSCFRNTPISGKYEAIKIIEGTTSHRIYCPPLAIKVPIFREASKGTNRALWGPIVPKGQNRVLFWGLIGPS